MRVLVLSADGPTRLFLKGRLARHRPVVVTTVDHAVERLRAAPPDAVVLDLDHWDAASFDRLCETVAPSASRLVMISRLNPASARRAVAIARLRPARHVLRDAEDASLLLRQALDVADHDPGVPARLLASIAPRVTLLPARLQATVVGLLSSAEVPRWVSALHEGSGMARRSLDRWIVRSGLGSAATLLDVVRLARAWQLIVADRRPQAEIITRLGYGQKRTLVDHARKYLGVPPEDFGRSRQAAAAVEMLTRAVTVSTRA